MKTKMFLIVGTAIMLITISLVLFNLSTSDYGDTEESDSKKINSNSTQSFTYQINSFDVPTTITGGSINKITKLGYANSIFIEINSFDKGYLIIKIPRAMLEVLNDDYSKFAFIVLSDGDETIYEQIDSETIKINFQNNTKKIEIVGTSKLN